MDKKTFSKLFKTIIKETGVENNNSKTNMKDAYETYVDLIKQFAKGPSAEEAMVRMTEMDSEERLHWRHCLAEEGIEMTPTQVDEYIVILELALTQIE